MALFNPFRESVTQKSEVTAPTDNRCNETSRSEKPLRGGRRFHRGRGRRGFRGGRRSLDDFDPEQKDFFVEFQCEACERMFLSESDLSDHIKLHVSCIHCSYSALQQLVSTAFPWSRCFFSYVRIISRIINDPHPHYHNVGRSPHKIGAR